MKSNARAVAISLFVQHQHAIYRFARRFVDHHTAEDATQEVFFRLLKVQDLHERTVSSSYVLKITHNLLREWARKKRVSLNLDERLDLPPDEPARPATTLAADLERLVASLARLNEREHATLQLVIAKDKTLQQAAATLGVPVTTVTNWKYRGLRKLDPAA
jgi:RNA polymerase sigma factor (sigma-70 family)